MSRRSLPLKVLVLFSWNDDISERRYHLMREDRRLARYDFEQMFALASSDETPEASILIDRISEALDEIRPDVLLIHTGAAFHRAPEVFAATIRTIATSYSHLRLGYEHRVSSGGFDDTRCSYPRRR